MGHWSSAVPKNAFTPKDVFDGDRVILEWFYDGGQALFTTPSFGSMCERQLNMYYNSDGKRHETVEFGEDSEVMHLKETFTRQDIVVDTDVLDDIAKYGAVKRCLDKLDPETRVVLECYYGLEGRRQKDLHPGGRTFALIPLLPAGQAFLSDKDYLPGERPVDVLRRYQMMDGGAEFFDGLILEANQLRLAADEEWNLHNEEALSQELKGDA